MNPILPGFNPDPSICRVGNDYFLVTSTFEYFPGVPVYHSTDLVNWKQIGHALTRRSQLDLRCVEPGAGVWAPTLRYWRGKWYLATCVVYSRTQRPIQPLGFYVSTDDIFDETSWSDPVYFDQVGIDQDLFFDDDDRVYLCTARFSRANGRQPAGTKLVIYGVEIDLVSGRSLSAPVQLRAPPVKELVAEGPHIIKRDGLYYLLSAEGGTGPGHHVIVSRAKQPLGPYELPPEGVNPAVFNGDDLYIQRTGHTDLVEGPDGRWWAVLLAVRPQSGGMFQLGRESFLVTVEWQDGWPKFNRGERVGARIQAELPLCKRESAWRDSFLGHTFEPKDAYEEAGTVVYYSGKSYAALLVRQGNKAGERVVVLRWTDPMRRVIKEIQHSLPAKVPVTLLIHARPIHYSFSYSCPAGNSQPIEIAQLPSKVLDGGSELEYEFYFTGAHFGLFAQGTDGEAAITPAVFTYAQYIEEM